MMTTQLPPPVSAEMNEVCDKFVGNVVIKRRLGAPNNPPSVA